MFDNFYPTRGRRTASHLFALLAVALVLPGCASLKRNPVPVNQIAMANVVGVPPVRAWGDEFSKEFQDDIIQSVLDERESDSLRAGNGGGYAALVLSGGSDKGTFGAGFLTGWTQSGERPNFKLVTGISVGALIAPFAFLGPDYDDPLERAFTTFEAKNVYRKKSLFKGPGESLASSQPLAEFIARFVTMEIIEAVAHKHARGQRLYIGTVNLDAQRVVIWNMGLIANRGDERALELFRKVMLASASIPVGFPPVYFQVDVDGERYDEMHVDGGTMTQFFFIGATLDLLAAAERGGSVYIIRNGKLGADPEQVPRKLLKIAGRAMSTMIKASAMSDLFRIYTIARLEGLGFYYVGIPDEFEREAKKSFDAGDLRRLFDVGHELALKGDIWRTTPRGWERLEDGSPGL